MELMKEQLEVLQLAAEKKKKEDLAVVKQAIPVESINLFEQQRALHQISNERKIEEEGKMKERRREEERKRVEEISREIEMRRREEKEEERRKQEQWKREEERRKWRERRKERMEVESGCGQFVQPGPYQGYPRVTPSPFQPAPPPAPSSFRPSAHGLCQPACHVPLLIWGWGRLCSWSRIQTAMELSGGLESYLEYRE